MWKATRISADAAEKMQKGVGIAVDTFDIANPTEPKDENILCETTGTVTINCKPITEDLFADVNNAKKNTVEGLWISDWDCGLAFSSVTVTDKMLQFALGAADLNNNGGIIPRGKYVANDFKKMYWLLDMMTPNKLLVIEMDNSLSDGLSMTFGDNVKGTQSLNVRPLATIKDPDKVPMAFYILEKVDSASAASVEPDEKY